MPPRKRVGRQLELASRRGPKGQRGEVADRIVSSARKSFSTSGFAGTTNRAIAEGAGVDAALVSYYFPSKAALLTAALEPPAGFIAAVLAAVATPISRRGAALVQTLIGQWEDPASAEIHRSIVLIAAHEGVAMDRLRQVFGQNILTAVSASLDDDERTLRAGLVASQMIGLAMARYVWQVGALATLPSEQVVRYVGPTIQRYLSGRL
jgi:AcrR family transcriptional regulator